MSNYVEHQTLLYTLQVSNAGTSITHTCTTYADFHEMNSTADWNCTITAKFFLHITAYHAEPNHTTTKSRIATQQINPLIYPPVSAIQCSYARLKEKRA
jgi:hypothetical protein